MNNKKEVLELSPRDFNKILEMVKSPPEPNEALKKAVKDYKQAIRDGRLVVEN